MSALTGNSVGSSYQGLAKTVDNGALGATEKRITDGLGNESTLSMGTNSASFDGTLDLSAATVTGDNNTTYTIDTAQSGSDATITLTGSDASTDTITLAAGTNITLTEAGDTITIDAAGGGGGGTPAPFVSYASGKYDGSAQGPYTFFTDRLAFYPVHLTAGQALTKLDFEITTAFTSASISFAVFTTQNTTNANGDAFVPHDNVASLGSVSGTTTGVKTLTGFNFTPSYSGLYFIAVLVPGVWDGAFGGYATLNQIGGDDGRTFDNMQYGGIPGTFFGPFNRLIRTLIDTTATIPSTYAANKSWSNTSARIFVDLRTN